MRLGCNKHNVRPNVSSMPYTCRRITKRRTTLAIVDWCCAKSTCYMIQLRQWQVMRRWLCGWIDGWMDGQSICNSGGGVSDQSSSLVTCPVVSPTCHEPLNAQTRHKPHICPVTFDPGWPPSFVASTSSFSRDRSRGAGRPRRIKSIG